jgi:hypothetical protein
VGVRSRIFGFGCAVAVVLTGAFSSQASASVPAPSPPIAGQTVTAPTVPKDATSAATTVDATAIAARFGHPVVVDADTSPTTQVVALPNGDMQLTSNTVPVRVKTSAGWVPTDSTLKVAPDGLLEPTATNTPIEISSGGSGILAKVQTSTGKWLSESSPFGVLPRPTVDGATATYAGVLPGVDLVLTATAVGMSEVLVVKNAAAAANPALKSVNFTLSGGGLKAEAGGRSVASAADGSTITSDAPTWWDSSNGSTAGGPVGDSMPEPVTQTDSGSAVQLAVGSAASTSGITYPAYIDPDWTGVLQDYWYVDQAYPNQSYLNGNEASGEERVGYVSAAYSSDSRNHLARAFWQMDLSGVDGADIIDAHLDTTENWAFNCTASPVEVYAIPASQDVPVGGTWNTTGATWGTLQDTQTVAARAGDASCPTAAVGFEVKSGVQSAANAGATSMQFGMRAASESTNAGWKEFEQSASLVIEFQTYPITPTTYGFSSPDRTCSTSATSPSFVNNASDALTMSAYAEDPDGTNVNTKFTVADGNSFTTLDTYSSGAVAGGGVSKTIPTGTLAPGLYAWNAQSSATTPDGAVQSGTSSWCYFQVQNTGPGLPTAIEVASSGSTTAITPATGTVGQPITVRLTASTSGSTAAFGYWWTNTAATAQSPIAPLTFAPLNYNPDPNGDGGDGDGEVFCPALMGSESFVCATSGVAVITVAPIDAAHSTLWVAAYDEAGDISTDTANVNDGNTSVGLQVNTAGDTTHVQYGNSTGGDEWSAGNYSSTTNSIRNLNTTTGHTALALTNPSMVTAMDPASPLNDANMLSFGGQVQLWTLYYTATSTYVTGTFSTAPSGWDYASKPPATRGWIDPYPAESPGDVAPAPTGMSTLYNCTATSGAIMNSTSSTCEGTGDTATPIGFILTAASSLASSTEPLYRCNQTGLDETTVAACGALSATTLLGYTELNPDAATESDTTELTDDALHGFTYSAWIDLDPSGSDYSNLGQDGIALAYDNTFDLGAAPDGTLNLCWSDWGPPAYEPCVTGPAITPGVWTYVSVIWDPSNLQLRLVVNGDVSSATVASRQLQDVMGGPSDHTFTVGYDAGGDYYNWMNNDFGGPWNGYIDDVTGFPGVADTAQLTNMMSENAPQ